MHTKHYELYDICVLVAAEVEKAEASYPKFNSAHEAYAIMLEEVDELWDLVKVKQANHDHQAMKAEAIQVAAMAIRFIRDVTGGNHG